MSSNSEINEHENIRLIKENPPKAIRTLAGPMIITLILCVAYSTVDYIWVAGLGSNALAAVGLVAPIFNIIGAISDGLGSGSNSLISRYIGAEKKHEANNSAWHGIIMGLIASILLPLILLPCLDGLLTIMGASTVMNYAKPYATIIILGSITFIFIGVLSGELRAEGNVKHVTLALIVSSILNIVLDPLFIYVLNWGVEGAAISTIFSSCVAIVLMVYWLFIKKSSYITLTRNEFHFNINIIKQILVVAIPTFIGELFIAIVCIVQRLTLVEVATTTVVAAYTTAWTVLSIGRKVTAGIGFAVITVGGVHYGAKNSKKLKTTYLYSIKLAMILSVIMVILMEILAPQIAHLFSYNSLNIDLQIPLTEALRILTLSLLTLPVGKISKEIFQGMGKGKISLALSLFSETLSLLIVLILTFVFGLNEYGVYYGIVIGIGVVSIIGFIVFNYYFKKHDDF